MYKTTKYVALASVMVLVLFGTLAYAEEMDKDFCGQFGPIEGSYHAKTVVAPAPDTWSGFRPGDLIGYQVFGDGTYGTGGMAEGQISDLVLDDYNRRIALVILDDAPGFGSRQVAVPFEFFERTQGNTWILHAPSGFFTSDADHPYFEALAPGEVSGQVDSSFVSSVYSRYGLAPYWSEGGDMHVYRYSEKM